MKKASLVFAFFLLVGRFGYGQDFAFGLPTAEDISLVKNDLDSFSNAAVLNEYGRAYMIYDDTRGYTQMVVDYHVRIKVFNSDGYRYATIVLPTYRDESGERADAIYDVKAVTINVDKGRQRVVSLDKSQLFKEEVNKYLTHTKFTFPELKDGSIIEYSFTLRSPNIFNFHTWHLQNEIPKIKSLFEAIIPAMYNYNVILRGVQRLDEEGAKVDREAFLIGGRRIDCSHMRYGMENIPAFVAEDYMTSPSNFKSAIYFELSEVHRLNGSSIRITKEWKNVDRELTTHADFGRQMKRHDVFKPILPVILSDTMDDLGKAKAIYSYVQRHIKWNGYLGKYSELGVNKAWEQRVGNIGDINLALISGLQAAGLDADAVLLSTRDNGVVNDLHPVLSDFNYVVAKVNIGDNYYLLDASDPLLPFGLLPFHCINGKARVISLQDSSYWIVPASSQKSTTQYNLVARLGADGVLRGQLTTSSYGYPAWYKRKAMANYNTPDEYIDHVDETLTGFQIETGEILGATDLDRPFVERYDIVVKLYDSLGGNELYLNPFFINRVNKNPFNLDERTYPVDMGAASEQFVSVTIQLPVEYELVSKPDDYNMVLENRGGRYFTQTALSGDTLTFSQLMALNQSTYPPESYFALKEFFSRIIQQEKIDVVLQKKGGQ